MLTVWFQLDDIHCRWGDQQGGTEEQKSSVWNKLTFASFQVLLIVILELLFQWKIIELSSKSELPINFLLRDYKRQPIKSVTFFMSGGTSMSIAHLAYC